MSTPFIKSTSLVAYDSKVAKLLRLLSSGPVLAHKTPQGSSEALIAAELRGFAAAVRVGSGSTPQGNRVHWSWSITLAGKAWLGDRSTATGVATD